MITKVDKYVAGSYRQHISLGLDFGGLAGGVLGTIGNLFGLNQQKKENARNRQFAHDEAVLAHERNLEIMDKTNQWNSPENQRKLLIEGGYNPNALFQNGGTVGRGSGSSGSAQASNPSQGSVGQGLLDPSMITALSQASLNEAQSEKIKAETGHINEQRIGQSLNNAFQNMVNDLYEKYGEAKEILGMQKTDAEISVNSSLSSLYKIQHDSVFDEMVRIRPLQAMSLVAKTSLDNSATLLNNTNSELGLKQFGLSLWLSGFQAAQMVASANADNSKASLDNQNRINISPGGVLWNTYNAEYWIKHYERNTNNLEHNIKQEFFKAYLKDIKENIERRVNITTSQEKYLENYWDKLNTNPYMQWHLNAPEFNGANAPAFGSMTQIYSDKVGSMIGK